MIYIIKEEGTGLVKIGYADNVERRLHKMQSDNPRLLSIVKVYDGNRITEGLIHEAFRHRHIRGDWFLYDPKMDDIDVDSLTEHYDSSSEDSYEYFVARSRLFEMMKPGVFVPQESVKSLLRFSGLRETLKAHNEKWFGTNNFSTYKRAVEVKDMLERGEKAIVIANKLGISEATVYRLAKSCVSVMQEIN